STGKLPVTFFLATNPADQLQGQVEMDELSAEVRGDSGNTVLVRVSFDQDELRQIIANPKIGASATAKIHCGKRAIGYVWFHDVVDFVRSKILFRIFWCLFRSISHRDHRAHTKKPVTEFARIRPNSRTDRMVRPT